MMRLYTLVTDEERIRLLAEGDATDRETHATHMHTLCWIHSGADT
jgi:hypothetical protein